MQLVTPDILAEARGLSVAISATTFAVGFLLWVLGWRGHRFWIVLAATAGAGIAGLSSSPSPGTQALAAGLLLAVAAGALALPLVRVVAFAAGGLAVWLGVHASLPAWDVPLLCFLSGGLLGLLLFRLWTMALTSCAGTLLMAYSGLCLAADSANLDVVGLAERQATWINVGCGGVALVGLLVQLVLDRGRGKAKGRRSARPKPEPMPSYAGRSWWGARQLYRRAG
jgi:hypothetical protein